MESENILSRQELLIETRKAIEHILIEIPDTNPDYRQVAYSGGAILRILFHAQLNLDLTQDEFEELLQPNLTQLLDAISEWISLNVDRFPPHHNLAQSKRERSALKYLLDILRNSNKTELNHIGKDFEEEEEIDDWDRRLKKSRTSVNFDLVAFDLDEDELEKLPKDHWWAF